MLIPSFFITEGNPFGDMAAVSFPDNAWPAYKIRVGDDDGIRSLFQSLFSGQLNISFCLLIEWDSKGYAGEEWGKLADHVISFVFNYYYLQTTYHIPFLIFKGPESHFDAVPSLFREKFRAQGYNDIDYIYVNQDKVLNGAGGDKNWTYFGNNEEPAAIELRYENLLRYADPSKDAVLLECRPGLVNSLAARLEQLESGLLADSPATHTLLARTRAWENRQKDLLYKIAILQERVGSLDSYQSAYNGPDSAVSRQVQEISDFYYKEYEILPLWYKRLGHILKVLTGKRTFRSLFNDNVKKYKV